MFWSMISAFHFPLTSPTHSSLFTKPHILHTIQTQLMHMSSKDQRHPVGPGGFQAGFAMVGPGKQPQNRCRNVGNLQIGGEYHLDHPGYTFFYFCGITICYIIYSMHASTLWWSSPFFATAISSARIQHKSRKHKLPLWSKGGVSLFLTLAEQSTVKQTDVFQVG